MPGFKRQTVQHIIEQKLGRWLDTLPPEIRIKIEPHIIVSGGCIASLLLGEPVKDYDLYCENPDVAELLAQHYVAQFNTNRAAKQGPTTYEPYVYREEDRIHIYVKSAGVAGESEDEAGYEIFEQTGENIESYLDEAMKASESKQEKYRPVFLSENAISLSDKVQIVIRFTGDPDQIHENYDYVHATNYYHTGTRNLVLRPRALESLLSKALIYTGSLYPICSLFRMRKFMDRGWRISAGEITKMALQISELDLKDPIVLREMLIGVDAAYFHQLLRMIEEWKENNQDKELDSSYVISLIDELSGNF